MSSLSDASIVRTRGGDMTPDTLSRDQVTEVAQEYEFEELLVEEVSIDGLCGVY